MFEWDKPLFFSGEVVSGKVKFNVTKTLKARGVKVTLCGQAQYTMKIRVPNKGRGAMKRKNNRGRGAIGTHRTEEKTMTENFFNQDIQVLPGAGPTQELQPGDYEYPFSWQLPGSSPSTWIAQGTTETGGFFGTTTQPKGYVKYWGKAEIDVPMGFDKNCESPFNVVTTRDLNNYSHTANPAEAANSKKVGFLCFSGGNINAKIQADKSGVVPGEKLDLKIEINNGSSQNLKVEVKLLQITKYKQQLGDKITIMSNELSSQPAGSNTPIMHSIPIPQLVPTAMNEFPTVDINYSVSLEIKAEGGVDRIPLVCSLALTVGNVPHKADFGKFTKSTEEIPLPETIAVKYPDLPTPKLQMDGAGIPGFFYMA